MSSPEINQVLAQMRLMSAQAQGLTPAETQQTNAVTSFSEVLKQSVNAVNEVQQNAAEMKTAFETGSRDVSLAEVMIASEKASVSFQAMVQVRNKLVDAYKDVMSMSI